MQTDVGAGEVRAGDGATSGRSLRCGAVFVGGSCHCRALGMASCEMKSHCSAKLVQAVSPRLAGHFSGELRGVGQRDRGLPKPEDLGVALQRTGEVPEKLLGCSSS